MSIVHVTTFHEVPRRYECDRCVVCATCPNINIRPATFPASDQSLREHLLPVPELLCPSNRCRPASVHLHTPKIDPERSQAFPSPSRSPPLAPLQSPPGIAGGIEIDLCWSQKWDHFWSQKRDHFWSHFSQHFVHVYLGALLRNVQTARVSGTKSGPIFGTKSGPAFGPQFRSIFGTELVSGSGSYSPSSCFWSRHRFAKDSISSPKPTIPRAPVAPTSLAPLPPPRPSLAFESWRGWLVPIVWYQGRGHLPVLRKDADSANLVMFH